MEKEDLAGVERKVNVFWDNTGLRCDPEELKIDSRRGDRVVWKLQCERRGARLRSIVFAENQTKGPFHDLRADGKDWVGSGSYGTYGRYKYSIWVEDEAGGPVELDPYILDTDRP